MFRKGEKQINEGNQTITDLGEKQEHLLENKVSAIIERKKNQKKEINIKELEHEGERNLIDKIGKGRKK